MDCMNDAKWRLGAAAAAVIVIVAAAAIYLVVRADSSPELTLAAAEEVVLGQYSGEIVGSKPLGEGYAIQLRSTQGLYELTVEPAGIAAIRTLERYGIEEGGASPEPGSPEPSLSPPPTATPKPTPPPPASSPSTNPSILITEQKATELALGKIAGRVKDIDMEQEGGKWYYLVEIESKDGREADVQLNAASGKVVSVTWDDDDD
jgi:hypothetical protein